MAATKICCAVFVLVTCQIIQGDDRQTVKRIHDHILESYIKNVRPSSNTTDRLPVSVLILPVAIIELDQARQVLTTSLIVHLRWKDPDLTWNETEFDGLYYIPIDSGDIWIPKLILVNGVGKTTKPEFNDIVIKSDGVVGLTTIDTFSTSCPVDITRYPFDEQTCDIRFGSTFAYNIVADTDTSQVTQHGYFTGSNEWNLIEITSNTTFVQLNSANMAQFSLKLERQWRFYVLSTIFPMVLLSLLNAFVFLLPTESGEKMSFLISILVSYFVFVNYINDTMPKSTTASRMAIYLVIVLIQSCCSIVINLIGMHAHYKSSPTSRISKSKIKVAPLDATKSTESNLKGRSPKVILTYDTGFFALFLFLACASLVVFIV